MPELNRKLDSWTSLILAVAILTQSFSFVSLKCATRFQIPWDILFIVLAFSCLILRAFVWQILLKHHDLSRIYPFNSLSQITTLVFSALLFHEKVTGYNIMGVGIMITGIVILSKKT